MARRPEIVVPTAAEIDEIFAAPISYLMQARQRESPPGPAPPYDRTEDVNTTKPALDEMEGLELDLDLVYDDPLEYIITEEDMRREIAHATHTALSERPGPELHWRLQREIRSLLRVLDEVDDLCDEIADNLFMDDPAHAAFDWKREKILWQCGGADLQLLQVIYRLWNAQSNWVANHRNWQLPMHPPPAIMERWVKHQHFILQCEREIDRKRAIRTCRREQSRLSDHHPVLDDRHSVWCCFCDSCLLVFRKGEHDLMRTLASQNQSIPGYWMRYAPLGSFQLPRDIRYSDL